MAEYIKREAGLRAVHGQRSPCRSPAQNRMLDCLKAAVIRIPAADVAPVVHAQWIEDGSGIIICPECKRGYNLIAKFTNYCPACGAKMDGKEGANADDHD